MTSKSLLQRLILLCLLFIALALLPFLAFDAAAQCVGELECYEPTPTEPGESGSGGSVWDGYTDGRLNPDQAEYYTIYCHSDTIFVVRVVPETQTIKEISLIDAISLAVGGEQALGDFMVMQRSSEDIITIWGSNGNLAPTPGSKAFSLSECIARNGGAPEIPPPPPTGNGAVNPPPEDPADEAARRRREAQESLDFCYDSYAFLNDAWLLAGCLNDTLADYSDALNGGEILSLIVAVFCLNIVVGNGILPIGIVAFLGWHRRWLRKQKSLD